MLCFCALDRSGGTIHTDSLHQPVTLTGSVGQGGLNRKDDVEAVQTLLNTAHQQVRTPFQAITIDGLVGPETIGAIKEFQANQLGFQDGRVDPNNKTINRLNQIAAFQGVLPPAPMPTPTPTSFATPRDAALAAIPLAQMWVLMALAELSTLNALQVTGQLNGKPSAGLAFPPVFIPANIHFHLDRDVPNLRRNLTKLILIFTRIQSVLNQGATFFQSGPAVSNSPFADAPMGGLHFPGTSFHRITFRPGFLNCGPNTRAAMLVHEGAHFVGGVNEISHFAMEFPIPNGQPQGNGNTRNYTQLTTSEAMRNASSYAAFAIHAAHLQDLRFGARDITL